MTPDDHRRIAEALTEAARSMHRVVDPDETMRAIVHTARLSIPEFDHVGISTMTADGQFVTRAAAGDLVAGFDTLQYTLGEGPCVDAMTAGGLVLAPKACHEQRWPRYMSAAVPLGLRSQMAVQIAYGKGTGAGLNLYSTTSDTIDHEAAQLAEHFAVHAAIALSNAAEVATLNRALVSRKVIGQAIGLLMERYDLDEDAAFAFLVRASSTSNIKLRAVAQRLVDEKNDGR